MKLTSISLLYFLTFLISLNSNAQGVSMGGSAARAANPDFPQLLEWSAQEKELDYKLEGTPYIDEEWANAEILFKSNEVIKNIPVKYDLQENIMEIKTKKTIKVCPSDRIIAFELSNNEAEETRKYVNCNRFKIEEDLKGFYEVLVDNDKGMGLFLKTEVTLKKSNYNPALDVGDMTTKVIKRDNFFLVSGDYATRVPKNKKSFLKAFKGKSSVIDLLLKEEKLKFNKKEDLIKVVEYYNSI